MRGENVWGIYSLIRLSMFQSHLCYWTTIETERYLTFPCFLIRLLNWLNELLKKCICMSLAKCEFPSQCALWAGACGTPSFLSSVSDTVVGCDLANQWFSQGSMFASLLIFPQGNKMSAVVSSFTSVFQIEENMWKETFAPLVRRENAFARVSGRYLLTYFTRALSDDQS